LCMSDRPEQEYKLLSYAGFPANHPGYLDKHHRRDLANILSSNPLTYNRYNINEKGIFNKSGNMDVFSDAYYTEKNNKAKADSYMLSAVMEFESRRIP
jgi:hypothetical protein